MTNVLFVCVANGGRSVMAERLFREAAASRHDARSAGSEPGAAAHPQVVEALKEIGIDASDHVPHKLDAETLEWADMAVSTCSEEVCPVTPGVKRVNWHLPDPKNLPLEQVRPIRDEIKRRVDQLVAELDAAATPAPLAGWKSAGRHERAVGDPSNSDPKTGHSKQQGGRA
jgi:arsenate reductase